ncbi:lipoprotein [Listeria grandensis FSL F6-0971]|uniref:Lipoprotein n=1 Tax=Listeria grandensis FSL F6-0971 TaxID=1265819 RepID=W7ASX6_9LIST|nr:immunoglobulin-like domain-containing protein [Listeria grandensis]EUJ18234.1 lipoprotein [Listeria grandensis FSL F6-0971]
MKMKKMMSVVALTTILGTSAEAPLNVLSAKVFAAEETSTEGENLRTSLASTNSTITSTSVRYNSNTQKFDHRITGIIEGEKLVNRTKMEVSGNLFWGGVISGGSFTSTKNGSTTSGYNVLWTQQSNEREMFEITFSSELPVIRGDLMVQVFGGNLADAKILHTLESISGYADLRPTITAVNQTISLGEDFDPLAFATAKDFDGTDVSVVVTTNNVDNQKLGKYTVTYTATGKYQKTTKSITVTVVEPDDGITKLDTFTLEESNSVTGTYKGNVSQVALSVNGVEGTKMDVTGGVIDYTAIGAIKKATDVVLINAYTADGKLVDSKPVTLAERELKGAITNVDNYQFKEDRQVKGTFTGDVDQVSITINGTEQKAVKVTGGAFQYYVWGLINNKADDVTVNAYDKNGELLDSKEVTISEATTTGEITEVNDYLLKEDRHVTGKFTGDVTKVSLTINGSETGKIGVTDGVFQYYVWGVLNNLSDEVTVNAYDKYNNLIDTKAVNIKEKELFGSITNLDKFTVGSDRYVTGNYEGDVARISTFINGTEHKGASLQGGNAFSFYAADKNIKKTDEVVVVAYDKNGKELSRETLNYIIVTEGKLTPVEMTIPGDNNVTGTYTGDVTRITLTVNGTEYKGGTVADGSFKFYSLDKIKNQSDVVVVKGYDATGKLLDTKTVKFKQAAPTVGTITPATLTIPGDKNIVGTYTGDVKSMTITVNGTEYKGGTIAAGEFKFYSLDKVKSANDTVIMKAFDKAGKLLDTKTIAINK